MPKPIDFELPPEGVTEILLHGVGGASPQDILGDPNPTQVAGDDRAGFYRPSNRGPRHVEAYSWGGLTSKSAMRSLWILLLPFTLVNLGGWMVDRPSLGDGNARAGAGGWLSGAQERLVRILGLILTVEFVMWGAALWVDLVSYQCGGAPECFSDRWWLGYLKWSVFEERPHRRVIAGLVVPLLMLLLVAFLGGRSRKSYDEKRPPELDPKKDKAGDEVDLKSPSFWYQPSLVKDMARLHVTGALAVLAGVTAYSINEEAFDRSGLLTALAIAAGVIVLVAAALLGASRLRRAESVARRFPEFVPRVLQYVAGAILVAVAAAVWPQERFFFPESTGPLRAVSRAPFYLAAVAIAIALLIALCQAVRRVLERQFVATLVVVPIFVVFLIRPDAWPLYAALAIGFSLAFALLPAKSDHDQFRWVAPAVTSLAGVLILTGSFAGGAIRLVDFLDRRLATIDITLPVVYSWVVVGFGVCLASILLAGLMRAVRIFVGSRNEKRAVWPPRKDGDDGTLAEGAKIKIRKRILAARGLVQLVRDADLLVTFLAGFMCLGAIVGAKQLGLATALGDLLSGHSEELGSLARDISPPTWEWLVTASTWLASIVPLAAVVLMQRAYSSERTRRQVGILWDLGTFWPRRYHPFAPPAYAERAVPELQRRIIEATNGSRRLILTGHSQGSVLGFAALASLPGKDDRATKIVFATHGSPLGSLYRRFFPDYFRSDVFEHVESKLRNETSRSWCNFYRPTDPIAGAIFPTMREEAVSENGDMELADPWRWWRGPGQSVPTLQLHSYYRSDPAMKKWIDDCWPGFETPSSKSD